MAGAGGGEAEADSNGWQGLGAMVARMARAGRDQDSQPMTDS